jgi:hypothetical protein
MQILDQAPVLLKIVVAKGGPLRGVVVGLGMEADLNLHKPRRFDSRQQVGKVGYELRRQVAAGRIHDGAGVDASGVIDRYAKPPLAVIEHLL